MAEKTDREAVKVLAIAVGVREAARQLGLNENTVRQWSRRYQWFPKPQPIILSPKANENKAVTSVTKPSEALRTSLEDDNRETKLSLSKGVRRLAKHIETMPEPVLFAGAANVKQAVSSASQIHNWEKEEEGSGTLSGLKVYSKQTIMNVQVAPAQPTDSELHRETGDPSAP